MSTPPPRKRPDPSSAANSDAAIVRHIDLDLEVRDLIGVVRSKLDSCGGNRLVGSVLCVCEEQQQCLCVRTRLSAARPHILMRPFH